MRAVEFIIREEKIQDGSMANFALSSSLEHNLRDDARFFSSGGPFSMSDRKAALFFIRIHHWSLSTAMLLGLHMDFKQGLFEAIPPPLVFLLLSWSQTVRPTLNTGVSTRAGFVQISNIMNVFFS